MHKWSGAWRHAMTAYKMLVPGPEGLSVKKRLKPSVMVSLQA